MRQGRKPIGVGGRVCARALVLVASLVGIAADAANAARVVDVRVGTHPGYARVVFETDAPALHEIVTAPAATPGEVVVRIAARSVARELPGRGTQAPEVVLEPQPDGTTLARIRAAGPVRVETQVLRAPPRVVLDLRAGEAEPAPAPVEATPEVVAAPDITAPPEPEPTAEPAPAPAPVEAAAPTPEAPPTRTPELVVETPSEEPAPTAVVPPPPPVVVVPLPRDVFVESKTPPVEAPPPAAIALEPRSLAVGAALGVGIALLGLAARRSRRTAIEGDPGESVALEEPDAAPPPAEPVTAPAAAEPEPPAPDEAPPPSAPARDPELAEDWVRIHRRLDARLADVAERLERVAARQADLDRREGAQTQEIAAQRAAIARLQRALRPPPRPRKTGKDAG